ncbi:MAG TPA: SDR family NAD(P)-dependent oxidoreductase, partial [Streptosporangiaceae bacterium]
EPATALTAAAAAWTRGAPADWPAIYAPARPATTPLPTYPFQHQTYWLDASGTSDATSAGLDADNHPFLAASADLPDGTTLLTGRITLHAHPWLADHAIHDTVILPGTAFIDLALHAAGRVGRSHIRELTITTPLALPEQGAVQVRVTLGKPDTDDGQPIAIYTRPERSETDISWTRHAGGWLTDTSPAQPVDLSAWPPATGSALDVGEIYQSLFKAGFSHGPAFQGLRAAWSDGRDIYAELDLPEGADATRFAIHPALLDAALQAMLPGPAGTADPHGQALVPSRVAGISLHAAGASALRVRMSRLGDDTVALAIADETGVPIAAIESLALRPFPAGELRPGSRHDDCLFQLDWSRIDIPRSALVDLAVLGDTASCPVAGVQAYPDLAALGDAVNAGVPAPPFVILSTATTGNDSPAAQARTAVGDMLRVAKDWLADDRMTASCLAVLTRNAVAAREGEDVQDLAGASIWGLLRSARSENPGRFMLIDLDGREASHSALTAILASDEPEIAVRDGQALVPRLSRTGSRTAGRRLDLGGTVVITGGTGVLGGLAARHLVSTHGVRHLLLTSRRGRASAGAAALEAELSGLGAHVVIEACDAADPDALGRLLATVPAEHPVTGIVHAAGVLDDGTIGSLTADQLDAVMLPKADAAWNLHELTKDLNLTSFIMFSSAAGTLGTPGQGNYAAANAFLDALAAHRRAHGLHATSIAWGLWAEISPMTAGLGDPGKARLDSGGATPLSTGEGLALLDAALADDRAALLAARLDMTVLRANAETVMLPPTLRGLIRAPRRRALANGPSLARRLADLAEAERQELLLDLVRSQIAAVLKHPSAQAVDPAKAFKDFGFDSLGALQFRNLLNSATGLQLPATMVFDYPTPAALAQHLLTKIIPDTEEAALPVLAELEKLEAVILAAGVQDGAHDKITRRLQSLLWRLNNANSVTEHADDQDADLESASDEKLIKVLEHELGFS